MQPGKISIIEVAVVLCVLGLVGALTIPRFTRADSAPDARAERRAELRVLRLAIERYRQDHQCFPAQLGDGASPAGSVAAFISQLTSATDANGVVGPATSVRFCYGPYLRDGVPGLDETFEPELFIRIVDREASAEGESAPAAVFSYNCDTGQITMHAPPTADIP